jgi:16S rRNA C1402 N4-methylase RsmH
MLFDFGVSSPQLDEAARAFPTVRTHPSICAWTGARPSRRHGGERMPEGELKRILWQYGEERYAGRVASAIRRSARSALMKQRRSFRKSSARPCPPRPAGEAAPGQTQLSGHPQRRERRTGRNRNHVAGGGSAGFPKAAVWR